MATRPIIVQSAQVSDNGWPVTFSTPPVAGNLILALVTQYDLSGVSVEPGWTQIFRGNTSVSDDVVYILAKVAGASESTSQQPLTSPNPRGINAALFEIQHWSGTLSDLSSCYAYQNETSSAGGTITPPILSATSLMVGIVATTGANTLPTISAGPSIVATEQGTSTNASPRSITVVSEDVDTAQSITASWGAALNNYMLGVAVPPATDTLRIAGTVNALVGGLPSGVERVGGMVTAMVGGLPSGTLRVGGMVVAIVVAQKQGTPSQVMLGTF